jgi:hypothetical protein
VATVIALLMLARVAPRRFAPADPSVPAGGMACGASALWLLPLVLGLPDSPASGGMVLFFVGAVSAAAYVAGGLAGDRRHALGHVAERPIVAPALTLVMAAVLAFCAAGVPRPTLWSSGWNLDAGLRLGSVLAAMLVVAVVLAVRERERSHRACVLAAEEGVLEVPGRLTLANGSRIEVPLAIPLGPVLVWVVVSQPSYRVNQPTSAPDCLAGTREALAGASERRLHGLDVLAVTSALFVSAPASADLSRALLSDFAERVHLT